MTTIRGVANGAGGANGAAKRHRRGGVNLDDVSKTIIELLQQDGRKSYFALAHPSERPDFHVRASWALTVYAAPTA